MKVKTKIIILVVVCLLVLVGALLIDSLHSRTYLVEVKSKDVIKMINDKEDFILLISQTTCNHCMSYKPKLESVANEYKIKIYYIQVDLMEEKETQDFGNYIDYNGTPTTVFIKDGVEKTAATRINGDASISKIKSKLKANGWIKK